jgi:hypothetical protein
MFSRLRAIVLETGASGIIADRTRVSPTCSLIHTTADLYAVLERTVLDWDDENVDRCLGRDWKPFLQLRAGKGL